MAFFGGELRECRGKRRCLNNTEGQVGSLFSEQGTVWRLEKRNKTNMQPLFLLCFLYALSVYLHLYIFTYIFFPYASSPLVLLRAGVFMCMAHKCLGCGRPRPLMLFFLHELRWAETFKAVFPGVILVYLHGYTQKATRRVELWSVMIDTGKTKKWVKTRRKHRKEQPCPGRVHCFESTWQRWNSLVHTTGIKHFFCFYKMFTWLFVECT